jgi:signal transduction histidine kinase
MSALTELLSHATAAASRDRSGSRSGDLDPDVPMLHRVRWRLIAWSAGSTVVVLVALGALLYWVVASSLAANSIAQLRERSQLLHKSATVSTALPAGKSLAVGLTNDPGLPGVVVGGAFSGTAAVTIQEGVSSERFTPLPIPAPEAGSQKVLIPAPEPATIEAAKAGEEVIKETDVGGQPVRIMTTAFEEAGRTFVVQALDFRSGELEMLRTLLTALVLGGLLVLGASILVGYTYAGRALVPIRESLRRQREFAADASHELRTPLAIVRGAAEELRRTLSRTPAAERSLEDIEAGTDRLSRLVDDLLLLARTDADAVELAHERTDLAEIAADGLTALEPIAAARGVRLRLDVESAPIVGDRARLTQLVGILVDNAIRHSPSGGHVMVSARRGSSLTIEDDGPGIAPEHLTRVFDRFWRAPDAAEGGTGLGLAIAAWIAEHHGGRIAVENRPEGGARFRVSLPSA